MEEALCSKCKMLLCIYVGIRSDSVGVVWQYSGGLVQVFHIHHDI